MVAGNEQTELIYRTKRCGFRFGRSAEKTKGTLRRLVLLVGVARFELTTPASRRRVAWVKVNKTKALEALEECEILKQVIIERMRQPNNEEPPPPAAAPAAPAQPPPEIQPQPQTRHSFSFQSAF